MGMIRIICLCLPIVWPTFAADRGQIPPNVPDNVRAWFRSVKSPTGVPCCDIADGHRTTWRAGPDGGYEVPINGEEEPPGTEPHWIPVPPEAIIRNAGNPVGEAIVWYRDYGPNVVDPNRFYVRCFVPDGGV
jgi:hypothetical protein